MLQSRTRRVTTLGQIPHSDNSGPNVGPGSYLDLNDSIANPVYTAFGTSALRKLGKGNVKSDTPGPGDYKNIVVKPTKPPISNAFKTKVTKMGPMGVGASIYQESSITDNPGPGAYASKGMGSFKSVKPKKRSKLINFPHAENLELNPPSIPRLQQSYGYDEENGVLQSHQPPKNLYSGLGNDTIGPAYYNPKSRKNKTAPKLDGKVDRHLFVPSIFRENNLPDASQPGPAEYDPHKQPKRRVRDRPSSSFASAVPMLYDPILEEMSTRPGPGRYRPRKTTDFFYDGPESFHSTATRNTDITGQDLATPLVAPTNQSNPGPADYETNVSAFETKHQQTLTDVDIGFGSTDPRYCLSEVKTDHDAAPGDTHKDTDKMFGSLGHKLEMHSRLGTKGVFGTTTARFKPGTKVNGAKIKSTPGVGSFSLQKPRFQRDRATGVFKSMSRRMPRVSTNMPPAFVKVGKAKVPGPGKYNLRTNAASLRGIKGFGDFYRFSKKQIFFGVNISDVPGPGRYRNDHNSVRKQTRGMRRSIKPNPSFGSSTTRSGHNSYLGKQQHGRVGPGSYGSSQNSMIKKSFNVAAGHVIKNNMKKTRRKGLANSKFADTGQKKGFAPLL